MKYQEALIGAFLGSLCTFVAVSMFFFALIDSMRRRR